MPLPLAATVTLEAVGRGPSADGLPPFSVPMRFFVTAAMFGMTAGGLLAWEGASAMGSRWTPPMLALTHLLTLGVLGMVMAGALFQVVPVLGGGGLPQARRLVWLVHPALAGGTTCLAVGLWCHSHLWLRGALVLLTGTVTVMGVAVVTRLIGSRAKALRPLRFAVVAGSVGLGLGLWMLSAASWPSLAIAYRQWTNLHATWAGAGLGLLMVFAVARQVLPMFHVTPPFATWLDYWQPWGHSLALVLLLLPWPCPVVGMVFLSVAGVGFSVAGLDLLRRRRRRRPDATVLAWQVGLVAIVIALMVEAVAAVWPGASTSAWWLSLETPIGLLFGFAGLGTILIGMLTRIVPFLAFLHSQRAAISAGRPAGQVPTMGHFLSDRMARAQVSLHVAGATVLVAAAVEPRIASLAGVLLAADFSLCLVWLLGTSRRYRLVELGLRPPDGRFGPAGQ